MSIQHVPIVAQIVDALTKPLGTTTFRELRGKLKVVFEDHHPSV